MSEPANDVLPAVDMPAAQVTITLSQSGRLSVRFPPDARLARQLIVKALDILLEQAFAPKDEPPRSRIVPVGAPIPGLRS